MHTPRLYLLVGYPGSGKTTVARHIEQLTGAEHLWTDWERQSMFDSPTHSEAESLKLYAYLNKVAGELLANGKSVIFDTSFNFRRDREHLQTIAKKQGADCLIIWVTTDKALSKERALHGGNTRNGYDKPMTEAQFERIVSHLEPPAKNEKVIKIEAVDIDAATVKRLLKL